LFIFFILSPVESLIMSHLLNHIMLFNLILEENFQIICNKCDPKIVKKRQFKDLPMKPIKHRIY